MAFISFALTKDEFLSGIKSVTRRDWNDNHFRHWCKWYDSGKLIHQAWDKVPFAGGKRIGWFKLVCRPYREKLADMPLSDLAAEGGMVNSRQAFCDLVGKKLEDVLTVIRFQKVEAASSEFKEFADLHLTTRKARRMPK